MTLPMPAPGFYYHYKHNPKGSVNHYAYEVLAGGIHTETKEEFVVYRSLYQTETQGGPHYWLRPLEMWMDQDVDYKDGRRGPRFTAITDPHVIASLKKIRDQMYR